MRVFVQIDDAPLYTVGGPHLITEILGLCGGDNVFADSKAQALPVDLESVLVRAPEVILSVDDADPAPYWARFTGARRRRARQRLPRAGGPAGAAEPAHRGRRRRRLRAPRRGARQARQLPRLARGAAAAALVLPEHFAAALVAREHAREHEQQVGQAVEVPERLRRARRRARASVQARRSARRQMVRARWQAAAAGPPPGRMNSLSGGRRSLKASSACSSASDVRGLDRAVAGDAELAAEVEQLVLHARQELGARPPGCRARRAPRRSRCSPRPRCRRPRRAASSLAHAAAVAEAGRAVVAGARVDLRQPVAHADPLSGTRSAARRKSSAHGVVAARQLVVLVEQVLHSQRPK